MSALVIPTLMYHSVRPEAEDYLTVREEEFERQIASLVSRHSLVLPRQFENGVNASIPPRPVVVTFDDSLQDNVDHAVPILEKHGAHAVFFAITGYLGQDNAWNHRAYSFAPHMSAADVRSLHEGGHEIGSHSVSHQRLRKLDDARLESELADSRQLLLETTGVAPSSFAYPYGDADDRCRAACRRFYSRAFGSARQGGCDWDAQPHFIRRILVGPEDTYESLEQKIAGYHRGILGADRGA
jgi:peptidoglycan/xylan/chitin deacetylase (PgdA/CDA1 family)